MKQRLLFQYNCTKTAAKVINHFNLLEPVHLYIIFRGASRISGCHFCMDKEWATKTFYHALDIERDVYILYLFFGTSNRERVQRG